MQKKLETVLLPKKGKFNINSALHTKLVSLRSLGYTKRSFSQAIEREKKNELTIVSKY